MEIDGDETEWIEDTFPEGRSDNFFNGRPIKPIIN